MTANRPSIAAPWLVAALLLAVPVAGQEAAAGSSQALARELLEVTGAAALGKQVLEQTIAMQRQTAPEVPQEFWDEFLASVDPETLTELIVPIYTRHLTREQMAAAIEFYSSESGRAIVAKLPVISQESMQVGMRWGMELGQEIAERLEQWQPQPDA